MPPKGTRKPLVFQAATQIRREWSAMKPRQRREAFYLVLVIIILAMIAATIL